MKLLLVGLGNIGATYLYTRHNVGFLVVDYLAAQQKVAFQTDRLAAMAYFAYKHHQVYMIKPTTYMNDSGKAFRYWLHHLKIPIEQSLTIVDDIALPFGTMRLRAKGSDAGHNGLKSIAYALASDGYPRLRMGIGNDFPKGGLSNFVLENFNTKELQALNNHLDRATQILMAWLNGGIMHAMNQFN
ncbi:MAG: aminoacyl-tRNA hydrolase [Candidatus Cardinium sp.]|uniref:aminoacyl-tRNA hydrolase n=1 Tax=Cardinium endosymbiont of Dermatophagoides farinae TaxID=2597823 RepID=UPI001182A0EB|nr:aminoacyl-tRNA hydrolase [Cardinium endosymbiont of Dermatophagoides farinae]TSJ81260.1 aminoacyl-tRNA hydrolase [Cardinium endosymbiont of Dermatophagoides farinae]UWW97318.1 MAG: aminoacyl-tRNA hydrolase [Candidatus Cardinium sp.]